MIAAQKAVAVRMQIQNPVHIHLAIVLARGFRTPVFFAFTAFFWFFRVSCFFGLRLRFFFYFHGFGFLFLLLHNVRKFHRAFLFFPNR